MRFKAGSVEPAHHHTHGHDVFVVSGRKTVENLTRGEVFELEKGSYLYTAVRVCFFYGCGGVWLSVVLTYLYVRP